MRLLLAFALVCLGAGAANAVQFGASQAPLVKGLSSTGQGNVLLEGGESCGSALAIGALPFNDAGYTCDNFDDISLTTCGYGYGSPDVAYSITGVSGVVISLQGSDYDTMVGVFNSSGTEICCNDDYFGLQSYLECCSLNPSERYCIVIDGYAGGCGNYVASISECGLPCDVVCPAGGVPEGEPVCGTDYYDSYNGGCNSVGFQEICPTDGSHVTVCAESGTYTYFGLSYRDTDWFVVYGCGGNITVTMEGEFNTQLILIGPPADCSLSVYSYDQGLPCEVIGPLSTFAAAGTPVWIWGGASVFSGIPCGADYNLEIDGICAYGNCTGTGTEPSTWGTVKGLYR